MTYKPFTTEKYAPNHEITGEFDKSLSAKCENGTFVGYLENDVLTFKGIPFAKAPVGKLRWKLPEPLEASDKVFEAYHSGKTSIQPVSALDAELAYEMGEDCLYLNVYKNITDKTEKKPVMVWIHGGAYLSGGNSSPIYDGYNLIANHPDVILVAINYRLGIMGFVDFSHIEGGENYPYCNFGIYDQIEALKWIKRNIAAFGGDPERITIFGESAGAGSSSILAIMKEAKGLFKRAIIQSGSVALCTSAKTTTLPADNLAKAFGAKNMDDLLAIPEKKIIEYWQTGSAKGFNNSLILDGHVFEGRDPFDLWEEGVAKDLEIIQGHMAHEWRLFTAMFKPKEFYDALVQEIADYTYDKGNEEYKRLYTEYYEHIKAVFEDPAWPGVEFVSDMFFNAGCWRQQVSHAKNGGRGYAYIMTQQCSTPGLGACHGTDFYFVFGNFAKRIEETPENRAFSNKLQEMWTNFAKTGNPSTEDFAWQPYDTQNHATAMLGSDIHMENDPWRVRRELAEKMSKENVEFRQAIMLVDASDLTLERYPQFKK